MKKNIPAGLPFYIPIVFAICLFGLAAKAAFNYGDMQRLVNYSEWMEHTWGIKDHLQNINLLMMDTENNLNAYYLSGNPNALRPVETTKKKLTAEFNEIAASIKDNPEQEKNLTQLHVLLDRRMHRLEENTALFEDGGLTEVAKAIKVSADWEIMDEVRLLDIIMEKNESDLLNARRRQFYDEYNRAISINNIVTALLLFVLILFYKMIQVNHAKRRAAEHTLKLANDNLETMVLSRTEQLSVLSRHLLLVSEEEKARLARELHDEMGSNLTAIRMDLTMVAEKLKNGEPKLAEQLLRAKRVLQETTDLKRRIIENLRPSMLDNLGLAASIKYYYEETTRVAGLTHEIDISEDFDNIDPAWSIALFRIAQESLNNVIKYARAKHVKISLKRKETGLWLQILDDGIGISKDALKKPRSHGLLGMRERTLLLGGSFSILEGTPKGGTAIEAFLPFPQSEAISSSEGREETASISE